MFNQLIKSNMISESSRIVDKVERQGSSLNICFILYVKYILGYFLNNTGKQESLTMGESGKMVDRGSQYGAMIVLLLQLKKERSVTAFSSLRGWLNGWKF